MVVGVAFSLVLKALLVFPVTVLFLLHCVVKTILTKKDTMDWKREKERGGGGGGWSTYN